MKNGNMKLRMVLGAAIGMGVVFLLRYLFQ